MKTEKEFPNGFTSWYETFYHLTSFFNSVELEHTKSIGEQFQTINGQLDTHDLPAICAEATDVFEEKYKDVDWGKGLDYYNEIDVFFDELLTCPI